MTARTKECAICGSTFARRRRQRRLTCNDACLRELLSRRLEASWRRKRAKL